MSEDVQARIQALLAQKAELEAKRAKLLRLKESFNLPAAPAICSHPLTMRAKELYDASSQGEVAEVRRLITARADVNSYYNYVHPLYIGAQEGHVDVVRMLLDAKAEVDAKNGDGEWSALWQTAFDGHVDCMRVLLEARANIEIKSTDDYRALYVAAEKGHVDAVRMLLDAKAEVDAKNGAGEWSALFVTASNGHVDCMRVLLEARANIEIKNKKGNRPLYMGAQEGHVNVVRMLLEAKTQLEAKNGPCDDSALLVAASSGHVECLRILLDAKANIEFKNKDGKDARAWAVEEGNDAVIRFLDELKSSQVRSYQAKQDIKEMTAKDVASWLLSIGDAYRPQADSFLAHGVTGIVLSQKINDDAALNELEVRDVVQRTAIRAAFQQLVGAQP